MIMVMMRVAFDLKATDIMTSRPALDDDKLKIVVHLFD